MEKNPIVIEVIIVATVTALLGLLGFYIAPAFFLTTLIMPLPLVYLIAKRDLLRGLLALLMTTVMLIIAFSQVKAVLLLIMQFGPLGIIIGLLLKNKVSVDKSMSVLFFWALILAGVNLLFSFVLSGMGMSQVTEEFRLAMKQMAELYGQNGIMSESDRQQFLIASEQVANLVQIYLPGSVAIWSIITTLLSYFLSKQLVKNLGISLPDNFQFTRWRLPWYSIWLIIIGLATTMLGDEKSVAILETTGKNILYISAFIFFILGNGVLVYWLQAWKVSKLVKIIAIVIMTIYLPFTIVFTLTCGVLDPVVNLRRLPHNGEGTKGG